MKKILMGSFVLGIFSLAIAVFQISCQKSAMAQTNSGSSSQLNLILYTKWNNPHTINSSLEIWLSNMDGTNQHQVPISLRSGLSFDGSSRLSPDGKTIVLEVTDNAIPNANVYVYTSSTDGSNMKKVIDGSYTVTPQLNGVY